MIVSNKTANLKVCEEAPVELILNGNKLVTFMCTPNSLKELALGYLYNKGIVKGLEDIPVLGACDDMRKIFVTIASPIPDKQLGLNDVLSSACGSGSVFTEEFLQREPIKSSFQITLEKLRDLSIEMFSQALMYKNTGGMHCAAIADKNNLLALSEDVGRHNAVDKIVGKGIFLNLDFHNTVILTTGRLSSDMILKAATAEFPIVVSRSIPTTLALEIAERLGITLVGRVVSKEPIIYTHPERII